MLRSGELGGGLGGGRLYSALYEIRGGWRRGAGYLENCGRGALSEKNYNKSQSCVGHGQRWAVKTISTVMEIGVED